MPSPRADVDRSREFCATEQVRRQSTRRCPQVDEAEVEFATLYVVSPAAYARHRPAAAARCRYYTWLAERSVRMQCGVTLELAAGSADHQLYNYGDEALSSSNAESRDLT